MSVVLNLHWPDITPDVYDAARDGVGWEEQTPDGASMHIAWFAADGVHVVDVWESEAHFQRFVTERLEPVVRGKLGITSDPVIAFAPLHRRFVAPGVSGASS